MCRRERAKLNELALPGEGGKRHSVGNTPDDEAYERLTVIPRKQ